MNNLTKEYIIDKNYIYKNLFEEIKDLLDENEKIKLVTIPRYVPIAFQVAKELNEEGIALYDEELKVERNSKEGKMKTKIYLSIKRKPEYNPYVIGKNHFYKNIFEDLKNYFKNHDKVTLSAKTGEVGIAFRVAKELVSQGIAIYDEELKLGRNFKEGQGKTQVLISFADDFFLYGLRRGLVAVEEHGICSSSLGLVAKIRGISEHVGKRDLRVY